jgi:hypothetical protein
VTEPPIGRAEVSEFGPLHRALEFEPTVLDRNPSGLPLFAAQNDASRMGLLRHRVRRLQRLARGKI